MVVAAAGLEEFGGPQDQQGGGAVADLERGDAGEQPAERAVQHGPDLDPERLRSPPGGCGVWRMA